MAQRVEDPSLSLLWLGFDLWPENFHIFWAQPKRKKKEGRKSDCFCGTGDGRIECWGVVTIFFFFVTVLQKYLTPYTVHAGACGYVCILHNLMLAVQVLIFLSVSSGYL